MAEPKTNQLKLELERYQLTSALKAVLHTILFVRALGQVHGIETDMEFADLTYTRVSDPLLDNEVNERVAEFAKLVDELKQRTQTIVIKFLKKPQAYFAKEVCWEQWLVTVDLVPNTTVREERIRRIRKLEKDLRTNIQHIIKIVTGDMDHMPPIDDAKQTCPFPFRIMHAQTQSTSVWKTITDLLGAPPGPGV